ncbi:MAG: hypothetical protein CYG61_03155 [Actinobacteria bacterium]|nr:MAG: hypothetical protein CYG61_03155 [Actinomycetota bacterium]
MTATTAARPRGEVHGEPADWSRRTSGWHLGALVVVVVAFVVSRIAIAHSGVVFDDRTLNDSHQLLELSELRDHPLRSLANLHSQPPLFNLFVALGLRAPESWHRTLFHLSQLAIGLGLMLCLYAVLKRLGVRSAMAVVLVVVFSLSPSVFLYENWFHYDYPIALMLCLAVLALQRYETGHRLGHAAIFFVLLGTIVLTRSMFHLFWMAAWVAVLVFHRRGADWRRVAAVAAVPLVAAVGLHLQRLVTFGTFSSTSSLGMSLAKLTTFQLTGRERQELVAERKLSRVALIDPFFPVRVYAPVVPPRPPTGVPVLDDADKTLADGSTRNNYNHINYLDIDDRYMDDVKRTMRMRPTAYARGVATAYDIFFRPPSDFFAIGQNREQVAGLDRLYNHAFYGLIGGAEDVDGHPDSARQFRQSPGRTAWLSVAAYAVAVVGGAVHLWRRRRRSGDEPQSWLVLAFLWSTVTYVMVLGTMFEVAENNRFRLYSDPLVLALVAALVVAWRRQRPTTRVQPAGWSRARGRDR